MSQFDSRTQTPLSDHPDWLPGECTKVTCEDGQWFIFYGPGDQYKQPILGEPQWHKDNIEVGKILRDLRPAWRAYREILQCSKMDAGEYLVASVKKIIDSQDRADVCDALKKCASIRHESEARSSQRSGAMAGSLCNMAQLWATTLDLAGKRLEILNNAS